MFINYWFKAFLSLLRLLGQRLSLQFRYLWLLCVTVSSAAVTADFDSKPKLLLWLEQLAATAQRANYQGAFVHSSGDYLLSMKVTHGFVEGASREILQGLDGMPIQYVRQGSQVVRTDYGVVTEPIEVHHAVILNHLMVNKDQWGPYYEVRLLGKARIANREVYEVKIASKAADRYSYKIWLDQHSGVTLGQLMLSGDRVLERFQFTQFQLLDAPSQVLLKKAKSNQRLWALLEAKSGTSVRASAAMPTESALASGADLLSKLQFAWLPPGFTHQDLNKGFYSDGLASFSVFVDVIGPETRGVGKASSPVGEVKVGGAAKAAYSEGATSVVSREYANNYQLVLVGELPLATLTKIGEAATFR